MTYHENGGAPADEKTKTRAFVFTMAMMLMMWTTAMVGITVAAVLVSVWYAFGYLGVLAVLSGARVERK